MPYWLAAATNLMASGNVIQLEKQTLSTSYTHCFEFLAHYVAVKLTRRNRKYALLLAKLDYSIETDKRKSLTSVGSISMTCILRP